MVDNQEVETIGYEKSEVGSSQACPEVVRVETCGHPKYRRVPSVYSSLYPALKKSLVPVPIIIQVAFCTHTSIPLTQPRTRFFVQVIQCPGLFGFPRGVSLVSKGILQRSHD